MKRVAARLSAKFGKGLQPRQPHAPEAVLPRVPAGSALVGEGEGKGSTALSLSTAADAAGKGSAALSPSPDASLLFPLTLAWSHHLVLLRVTRPEARSSYEIEASRENWSVRELERQVGARVDLKMGKLTHQDLGQMQMYVNFFDRFQREEHEAKTIGIVLCSDKNDAMVRITLPDDNEQVPGAQRRAHAGFGWGRAETYPGMNPGKAPRAHQTAVILECRADARVSSASRVCLSLHHSVRSAHNRRARSACVLQRPAWSRPALDCAAARASGRAWCSASLAWTDRGRRRRELRACVRRARRRGVESGRNVSRWAPVRGPA